jgi:hypothetical protein
MRKKAMSKYLSRRNVLLSSGVLCGIIAAFAIQFFWDDVASVIGLTKPLTPQEIVARDLSWAAEQSASGIAPRLDPVREIFAQARQGSRAFVDDALGWDSKWKLITDFVSSGDEHSQFLKEQFSKRMFSPEQLERAVESSVDGYMKHLEDVDSQLLVRLQADLADVPIEKLPLGIDRNEIRRILDAALAEARTAAEADFRGMVGREIVSLVAGEVLAAAAVELGTSTGILGAGAASGTVTFGAGLVVGVIADYAVSWAYEQLFDPPGELTKRVNQQLDRLERLIVVGTAEQPGLERRFQDYSRKRSESRDAAIKSAIFARGQLVAL